MSLSQNMQKAVDDVVGNFIQQIAKTYNINQSELLSMWNGKTAAPVETSSMTTSQPTSNSCGASEELMKMKKGELQTLCKNKGVKHTGTKTELVNLLLGETPAAPPAKKTAVQPPKKADAAPPPIMKKISATVPTIAIRRNQFNNYEHPESGLVFDKQTKKVIGKQNDDGSIDDLNAELVDLCNKHKFEYELPTDLDKKSGLDDVEIEELDDELIESDDEVVDEFVEEELSEEELSEEEYEEIEEE